MAFTRKYDSYSESGDEDISTEELAETYRYFLIEWKESCMREEKYKKIISALVKEKEKPDSTIAGLKQEVTLLNYYNRKK